MHKIVAAEGAAQDLLSAVLRHASTEDAKRLGAWITEAMDNQEKGVILAALAIALANFAGTGQLPGTPVTEDVIIAATVILTTRLLTDEEQTFNA